MNKQPLQNLQNQFQFFKILKLSCILLIFPFFHATAVDALNSRESYDVKDQVVENPIENDTQIQNYPVKGTITDSGTGEPLPGVNIVVKGTTKGTISDLNGNYQIDVALENAVLEFSFVGYIKQEMAVNSQSEINITLVPDIEALEEVVVIGYGTQRAEDLTGSVSVVSVDEMKKTNYSTVDMALQGRASGVIVTRTSGSPGSDVSIKIRGIGSINSSSDPLYIVDNLPVENLNGISPEDIESVQILKDASATAIYGARGANGVIIVTTNRGNRSGKISGTFSAYAKMSDFPEYRRYDIMNAEEYVSIMNEAYDITDPDKKPKIIASDSLRNAYGNTDTDWQDELLRTGWGQNYHAALSGGKANSNFSISGNYYTEQGVMVNTVFDRFNLRANSDFSLFKDRLKIGESIILIRTKHHGGSGGQGNKWVTATYATPLMPVYESKNLGGYAGPTDSINGANETTNPVAEQMLRNQDKISTRALTNMYAEVVIVKGLKFKINLGLTFGNTRTTDWIPKYELGNKGNRSHSPALLTENSAYYNQFLLENLLTYSNQIKNHNFTLLAGHSRQKDIYDAFGVTGQTFRSPDHNKLSQAETLAGKSSYYSEHIIDSYLARLIYDYRGKYLLTASVRRDGSSRFGPDGERYGTFPSFSVGWKLNEDFMPSVDKIGMLKLRFGWGHTGNMNIGDYVYETTMLRPDASRYLFGMNETLHLGATDLRSTGNPLVQWEHSIITNFGLDLYAFENKLELSAEYYIKNQDNMLTTIELPLVHGKDFDDPNSNPWYNLGDVQNKGIEMSLLHRNTLGKFNYSVGGNFTSIKNTVVNLPNSVPIYTDYTITREGNAIGSFYGYIADGIFQTQEEIDNYVSQGASPGDIKFLDLNEDGIINSADRTIIGKPIPNFTYGINFDMSYYGFDFAVFLYGMQNLDVYNEHYSYIGLATDRRSKDLNKLRSIENYWTPENPTNTQTRLSLKDSHNNGRISSWFVEDASFLRIQSVQLGYSLPGNLMSKINLTGCRIYVNAQNLHVFTKYKGYDPEVGSTNVLAMGIDQGYYPIPRSIIFGIQIDL